MNVVIIAILLITDVLIIGQAIIQNSKLKRFEGQMNEQNKALKIISHDELETYMSIKDIHGKGEETNQTIKEGFEKLGYDLLETQKNVEKLKSSVRQESAKNIMLHVRGVKNV